MREYQNIYEDGGDMQPDPSMGPQDTMGTPPEGGGGDAAAIQQQISEYAQSRDPQLAVQICDSLVQAMGAAGGGGAPGGDPGMGGGAPQAGGPPQPAGGNPMARNGMRFQRIR